MTLSERNKDAFKAWLLEKGYDSAQVENILAALHYFSGYCAQQLQCAELMSIETSGELSDIRERLIKRLFATFDQYHRFMREREASSAPVPDGVEAAPAEAPSGSEPGLSSPALDVTAETLSDGAAPGEDSAPSPAVSSDEIAEPSPTEAPAVEQTVLSSPAFDAAVEPSPVEASSDEEPLDEALAPTSSALDATTETPSADLSLGETPLALDPISSGVPDAPEATQESAAPEDDPQIQAIEKFILDTGLEGTTLKDITNALHPDLEGDALSKILAEAPRIVPMPKGRYVHAENFVGLEGARETLQGIITEHFSWFGGHINMWLLFDEASKKLPDFLRENHCENRTALYAVTRYLFEKGAKDGVRFVFEPPRILDPSKPVSEF